MAVLVIGLTGGIACGKSTVAHRIFACGIPVIDTDEIARDLTDNDDLVRSEILAAFQTLDRSELRRIAFASWEKRRRLELILHPRIRDLVEQRLETLRNAGEEIAVVVVPLLFETGWDGMADHVIAVVCEAQEQLRRLLKREGMDLDLARSIVASQMSVADKSSRSDFVIDTTGSRDESAVAADDLIALLRRLAATDAQSKHK